MAFFEMNFYSNALGQQAQVNVILPDNINAGEYKTLWLLHGLSDNHTIWLRRTKIELYAAEHRLAVVMPNVDRSWYTNSPSGRNYFTYITEELPAICRSYFKNMSDKREDNIIAGLSMGGYGAIKAALTFPERYAYCAALSGAFDIVERGKGAGLTEWKSVFDYNMENSDVLSGSHHDVFALAKRNKEAGLKFPKLFLWCGTEDSLLSINREFDELLSNLEVEHTYNESEGDHSWKWWDMHIKNALDSFLK